MRIYLDLETTGLSVWEDRITQIGAVATRDKQIISEFSTYVFTDRPIHPSAEKVTGISNETIKEAPPSDKALSSFLDWVHENCQDDEEVVFVAYNGIGYDFFMLLVEMHRLGWKLEEKLKKVTCVLDPLLWAQTHLDTSTLKRKPSGKCSFKLGDVHYSVLGENFDNAHDAMADTRAMCRMCNHETFAPMLELEANDPCCVPTNIYVREFYVKRAQRTKNAKNTKSLSSLLGKKRKISEVATTN